MSAKSQTFHDRLEAAGHKLQLDEDGHIDDWVHRQGDYHNGPGCVKCGRTWCQHCDRDAKEIPECPCKGEITWDVEITEVTVRHITVTAVDEQEAEDYGKSGIGVPQVRREKVIALGVVARRLSDE